MGYEYGEVAKLKGQLLEFRIAAGRAHDRAAKRVAQLAIRKVKQMTPVDKGDLRNNWKFHVVKKVDTYTIVIYNQLEYASFVEKGHRIVSGGVTIGWVEGRFMLELTEKEMDRIAPNMWLKEVEKEMRRIFGK
ncbi:HK97 gp10 family phage protein [Sutcliffiella rhizosphaerae]|uniref:HK97 gp10 family phage protein n=1 Tax=Sutcliffiella rhizosphaerae TaxID=2880967 RepID=A0ABM8YM48_9BACI|nr:HK97 gp10 family phage protein [Sutcliffiella rhizosphaerae]CAG9620881.1 hypothetical protein BACCIP111883_01652 [Sutcliffiella rhizosphaerae]